MVLTCSLSGVRWPATGRCCGESRAAALSRRREASSHGRAAVARSTSPPRWSTGRGYQTTATAGFPISPGPLGSTVKRSSRPGELILACPALETVSTARRDLRVSGGSISQLREPATSARRPKRPSHPSSLLFSPQLGTRSQHDGRQSSLAPLGRSHPCLPPSCVLSAHLTQPAASAPKG
jgi:hypothetical protein